MTRKHILVCFKGYWTLLASSATDTMLCSLPDREIEAFQDATFAGIFRLRVSIYFTVQCLFYSTYHSVLRLALTLGFSWDAWISSVLMGRWNQRAHSLTRGKERDINKGQALQQEHALAIWPVNLVRFCSHRQNPQPENKTTDQGAQAEGELLAYAY